MQTSYPLHEAVEGNDHTVCWEQLTNVSWLPNPLPPEAHYPAEAFAQLSESKDPNITAVVTRFLETMQQYAKHHMERINTQRAQANSEGCTPLLWAQRKETCTHFAHLLDPADEHGNVQIYNAVIEKLNDILTKGECGFVVALRKQYPQRYCNQKLE